MLFPAPLAGGVFLGWVLGANDAANVFGTAVASRVVTYRTASILCLLAVVAGAFFQGEGGLLTYKAVASQDLQTALVVITAAGITTAAMTVLKLPISTSQSVVGALTGIGIATDTMNWQGIEKIVICWLATPVGGMFFSVVIYFLIQTFLRKCPMSLLTRDKILWSGLILTGIYGSYALGANNVANAVGVFSGQFENLGIGNQELVLIGGLAIGLGAMVNGKRVMLTLGSGLMPLDAFTGLVAVASMAVTVHIFAMIGVPVSTSQAIVGAILGIAAIRRSGALRYKILFRVFSGWITTPLCSLILSAAGYALFI